MNEFRVAFRRLTKTPGFTSVAILTLGLGIGASTAIFSIVNGVLLRPLGYAEPDRLVFLRESTPSFGREPIPVSANHFRTWQERAGSFTLLSVIESRIASLTGSEQPELVEAANVSAGFFAVLGTPLTHGRGFLPEEETAGREKVVVITAALRQRHFGVEPDVIGRTLLLDREPHTVVGVLPAGFQFPQTRTRIGGAATAGPEVFKPKVFSDRELRETIGSHNYGVIGRLRPGVSAAAAQTELNEIGLQIARDAGQPGTILRADVTPLHEAMVGRSRRGLLVLFAAVASVLLIACVNLMNFLLAQAERRQAEAAVRQALGASRGHLIRGALTEAMLVAIAGGALGVALAYAGLALLLQHAPADLPRVHEVRIDSGVLLFALGSSFLTGLLFGLAPAWRLARSDPQQALSAANRTLASGKNSRRWTDLLVTTEVTLSVVLLAVAALFGGSFVRLLRTEQGFRAPTVLSASLVIPYAAYTTPEQRFAFFEHVVERLAATPGITGAAMVNTLPLQGENWVDKAAVAGDPRPMAEKPNANVRFISPDYFHTMGLPLRAGRAFDERDRGRKVMIISETLAQLLWPGQDPLGRRIDRWINDEFEVIGVAADVRTSADRAPVPTVYRQHRDWPPLRMIIVARAADDAYSAAGAFRAAIQSVDANVPIPALHSMDEILDQSLAQQRFQLLLVAVFAGSALLLTILGIYGVVAYAIARRQKELGIRIALGATPAAVRALVMRRGMRPVVLGLTAGLALTLAGGRVIDSLLFETRTTDPALLAAVAGLLTLSALAACHLPGRRASRVDPIEALRAE